MTSSKLVSASAVRPPSPTHDVGAPPSRAKPEPARCPLAALGRAPTWSGLGLAWTGDHRSYFDAISAKTSIGRIGLGPVTAIVVSGPEAATQVAAVDARFQKGETVRVVRDNLLGSALAIRETDATYEALRDSVGPHFKQAAVVEKFGRLRANVEDMLAGWRSQAGQPFDAEPTIRRLTMRAISECHLEFPLSVAEGEEVAKHLGVLVAYVHGRDTSILPDVWMPAHVKASSAAARAFATCVLEHERWRLSRGEAPGLVSAFFGKGLTEHELVDQVLAIFFGGHETTTHLISMAVHHLAEDPAHAVRIRDEARALLAERSDRGEDGRLTASDLNQLEYLARLEARLAILGVVEAFELSAVPERPVSTVVECTAQIPTGVWIRARPRGR